MAHTEQEKRDKVRAMINDIQTAMMVTLSRAGTMHGRPMATAQVDEGWDTLWFATYRDSGKLEEIAHDERVCLTYNNASGSEWVSVSGVAQPVDDRDKASELWSPHWKNWFDDPADPKLVLIEVQPHGAEYWDEGSRTVHAVKLAAAAVTGKHFDEGENESVSLRGR